MIILQPKAKKNAATPRIVKNTSCCMDQKIASGVTRKTLQRPDAWILGFTLWLFNIAMV
jgi:hypothetical protein